MLDFCIMVEGKHQWVGALTMHDISELRRLGCVKQSTTGTLKDGADTLPFLYDYTISLPTLLEMQQRARTALEQITTPGFKSPAAETYLKILKTAIESAQPLIVIYD